MPPKSQQRTPEYLIYTVPRNTCDPFIETFYAACRNNDAAVALQLAPGRDVRILTFGLSKALGEGHLDLARQLREAGAKWDTSTVFVAAKSLGTVKFLVESGFDINAALVGGGNILSMVIRRNDEASIRYLLGLGADPNLGPYPGFTAQTLGKNSGQILNTAAACSKPEIFALLLSHGADLSKAIPLHYAVGSPPWKIPGSKVPMLEYLLELGVDINGTHQYASMQKGTPLDVAILWGRHEEAKWLQARGAKEGRHLSQ